MGFLQQLEETLGTYGGAAKEFITNNDSIRATNNLSQEDEDKLYKARLAGMRKRADLKSIGEGMDAFEEGAESPDAMAAVEPEISAIDATEPELVDDSSASDQPMGFNEAVEAQLAADVPMPEATGEAVVAQRDRVDAANAERKAADQAETQSLNDSYADNYEDIQDSKSTNQAKQVKDDATMDAANSDAEEYASTTADIRSESQPEATEAEAVEPNMERAAKLFATTHGGDFDPKSSMDKAKMNTILEMMAKQPDLNDMEEEDFEKQRNKFALSIYRL